MTEPIEFVRRDDPTGPPSFFACPKCGELHSPRTYAGKEGVEHARRAAADCRSCRSHQREREEGDAAIEAARAARIAKARTVTDLEACFSDRTQRFYMSIEDAADAGETGVFGADFHLFRLDGGCIAENILSDHAEEADEDDIEGLDALHAAIDEFNAKQTRGSYTMDDKRWQGIGQHETFAMIKPDATARGIEDEMIADIEAAGFRVKEARRRRLERREAEFLYEEHGGRDHFSDLVDYTISGEVVMLRLEADHADTPTAFRKLMGATDHTKAEPGTLRAKYAVGYRENSVHGSDSPRAAVNELAYFFR